MPERIQFGLVVRGQAEPGEDIARRFAATLRFARAADRLGYNSLTKTVHYSTHPFQMLQEDNLIAVRRLWTEDKVTMTARAGHFELDQASCLPKPLQKPHPPIWVGANADPAVERAARLGDCWYIGPGIEIATVARQMDLYRRALDAAGRPFPVELPMRREVFVARSRAEAIRLCAPYLSAKYKAYHAWHQDLPPDDSGFDQDFETLIGDRFLIGSPDEVAEQILALHRRLGVNHLVMSTDWAGMPEALALDTIEMIAKELIPRVRQGL